MATGGRGTATAAMDTADSATLTIISRRRPTQADQAAEEEPRGHRGHGAQGQQQPDDAGGQAPVGAEGGQVDEGDVDGGQHDAADQQRAHQARQAQQRAHAAARGVAARPLAGRHPQERGADQQDDAEHRGGRRRSGVVSGMRAAAAEQR